MVVKGRGKFPAKKPKKLDPPTSNIKRIASLTTQDASDKALELIHEVAQLVAPIMHHYNFHVNLLCEMYPKNPGLLGLNVNRGQKICLRLRSPTDNKWFLERDEIVGTMLHELTHNICGPHNAQFYKLLDELKDKYLEFQVKKSLQNCSYPNNFSNNNIRRPSSIPTSKYVGKVFKLGTQERVHTLRKLSQQDKRSLMLQAAERRRADNMKCTELEEDKLKSVPGDDELNIIDVISLDSDEEEGSMLNDSKTNKGTEIEICDENNPKVAEITVKQDELDGIEVVVID